MGNQSDIENILNIISDGIPRLYTLELTLTNKCNLNCLSCIARRKNKEIAYIPQEELSDKQWIKVVEDAVRFNVKEIFIKGGGEALYRAKLIDTLLTKIKKNNISIGIITNGTLFNKNLIKHMVQIGFDDIYISLDGPNARINDYLRGKKGTFNRIVKNIKLFNFWKEKYYSDYPHIHFVPVLSKKNYYVFDKFVLLAKKFKVSSIQIQPIQKIDLSTTLGKELMLTTHHKMLFKKNIEKAIKIAEKNKINNNFNELISKKIYKDANFNDVTDKFVTKNKLPYFKSNFLKVPCFHPWTFMSIEIDGKIKKCNVDGSKINSYNIKNHNLMNVWYCKEYIEMRNQFLKGSLMNYCRHCCPATALYIKYIKERIKEQIYQNNLK